MSNLEGRNTYEGLVHLPELSHLLSLEIPYFDLAGLISKDYFYFVGMQYSAVNHHASIITLTLITLRLEVKNLNAAIFASDEEPLILPLKLHGDRVSFQPIKSHLASVEGSCVVNLNKAV